MLQEISVKTSRVLGEFEWKCSIKLLKCIVGMIWSCSWIKDVLNEFRLWGTSFNNWSMICWHNSASQQCVVLFCPCHISCFASLHFFFCLKTCVVLHVLASFGQYLHLFPHFLGINILAASKWLCHKSIVVWCDVMLEYTLRVYSCASLLTPLIQSHDDYPYFILWGMSSNASRQLQTALS